MKQLTRGGRWRGWELVPTRVHLGEEVVVRGEGLPKETTDSLPHQQPTRQLTDWSGLEIGHLAYVCLHRIDVAGPRLLPGELCLDLAEPVLCPVELVAQGGGLDFELEVGTLDGEVLGSEERQPPLEVGVGSALRDGSPGQRDVNIRALQGPGPRHARCAGEGGLLCQVRILVNDFLVLSQVLLLDCTSRKGGQTLSACHSPAGGPVGLRAGSTINNCQAPDRRLTNFEALNHRRRRAGLLPCQRASP